MYWRGFDKYFAGFICIDCIYVMVNNVVKPLLRRIFFRVPLFRFILFISLSLLLLLVVVLLLSPSSSSVLFDLTSTFDFRLALFILSRLISGALTPISTQFHSRLSLSVCVDVNIVRFERVINCERIYPLFLPYRINARLVPVFHVSTLFCLSSVVSLCYMCSVFAPNVCFDS